MLELTVSGWIMSSIVGAVLWLRARAMKSRLNFGIHEIRRPLQQAYLLAPAPDRSSISAALEGAVAALDELEARVNRRCLEPRREQVDLRRLVEASLEIQRAIGPRATPEVDWRARSGEVLGDPAGLQRIFDNLIDNATRHGAPPFRVSARESGDFIRVAVGNAPRANAADAARMGADPGRGYGLRIVGDLVREHGGRFAYSMRPGDCEAVVELPLAPI